MTIIHASCIRISDAGRVFDADPQAGVLILGDSGTGKSDLVLCLLSQGASLVADDRVELSARDGALWAQAPARLAGLLEARGVGIVALPFTPQACVTLVVQLVARETMPRLPPPERYRPPAALALAAEACPPILNLPAFDASTVPKVLLAAAAFSRALFRDESNPK